MRMQHTFITTTALVDSGGGAIAHSLLQMQTKMQTQLKTLRAKVTRAVQLKILKAKG